MGKEQLKVRSVRSNRKQQESSGQSQILQEIPKHFPPTALPAKTKIPSFPELLP
jgi:hypothetical protein